MINSESINLKNIKGLTQGNRQLTFQVLQAK